MRHPWIRQKESPAKGLLQEHLAAAEKEDADGGVGNGNGKHTASGTAIQPRPPAPTHGATQRGAQKAPERAHSALDRTVY